MNICKFTIKGKYEPRKCGKGMLCCVMGACLLKTLAKRKVSNCIYVVWYNYTGIHILRNKTFCQNCFRLKTFGNIRVIV